MKSNEPPVITRSKYCSLFLSQIIRLLGPAEILLRRDFKMRRFLSSAGWVAGVAVLCSVVAQTAFAISSAVNLSTRMVVQTGDNVLIGGFIVYGSGQKKIAVRAIGPSLPLPGLLSDPLVEL